MQLVTDKIIPKFGYYTVGLNVFQNKIEALAESKRTGQACQWNYNNEIFEKFDWYTPPTLSLKEVYKQRALQIREKYDYIVLNYSGGSDSHNVLKAFLENNIKLDEILVRNPWKRTERVFEVSTDISAGNHMSEWYLTTLPDLKKIKNQYPGIHIELYDHSDDQMDFWTSTDAENSPWFLKGPGAQLSPSHAMRWKALDMYKRKFNDRGLKGCHLYGCDKPRMCYTNGKFFVFYLDAIISTMVNLDGYDETYGATELFYWGHDAAEVIKAQTHYIMNHMKQNPHLLPMIAPEAAKSYELRNQYEVMVRNLVYPYWDQSRFQVKKPSSIVWCELDNWMYTDANANKSVIGSWEYSLDYIEQQIDSKYITRNSSGQRDGLTGMTSPFYKIGEFTLS
jgi:hypothetical protein